MFPVAYMGNYCQKLLKIFCLTLSSSLKKCIHGSFTFFPVIVIIDSNAPKIKIKPRLLEERIEV